MPFPFILAGIALAAAGVGVKKGLDARRDMTRARDIMDDANWRLGKAYQRRDAARERAVRALETLARVQLRTWNDDVGRFAELFARLKNVELPDAPGRRSISAFEPHELNELTATSLRAAEIVGGGAGALGSGALAGVASYGAATMLATASTGTAISTLSGAAATNATLAWFGGGAISAGGAGMAGGAAILGGLVAGPAIAVGGLVLASKARASLADARRSSSRARVSADEMDVAAEALELIERTAASFEELLERGAVRLRAVNDRLATIIDRSGTDYEAFDDDGKRDVFAAVQVAKAVVILLDTPLLSPDGSPVRGARRALGRARKLLAD